MGLSPIDNRLLAAAAASETGVLFSTLIVDDVSVLLLAALLLGYGDRLPWRSDCAVEVELGGTP